MDELQYVPHYVQIKAYLRTLAAEKKANDKMPSEAELSSQFNVSRGTAKQAIMELVNEGLLYRLQGRGTFVSEPRITRSFDRLPSFTEDIRRMGKGPQTQILSIKQAPPLPNLVSLFNLKPGELVCKFKRVVSTEGTPVVVLTSYLNPHFYPELKAEDIGNSLYEALKQKYRLVPSKARDTYSIVDISPRTASLLKCSKDQSVCFSQRIGYIDSGEAVEYVESFIRSDRFKFNIYIGMDETETLKSDVQSLHSDIQYSSVIL